MTQLHNFVLPHHIAKKFSPINSCIYCLSTEQLTTEHIIPYSLGGRWTLPASSCKKCAAITAKFEGEFARTIFGPLRMLYGLPTRRPKDRPKHLPLKVKYPNNPDWETVHVERGICPFLVGLPLYPLPDGITGDVTSGNRGDATSSIWIRGADSWLTSDEHLQRICDLLGASKVMPEAVIQTAPLCLLVAKVAHAFTVVNLGLDGFEPFLKKLIIQLDLSNRAQFIGGGQGNEPLSNNLHDVVFDDNIGYEQNIVLEPPPISSLWVSENRNITH